MQMHAGVWTSPFQGLIGCSRTFQGHRDKKLRKSKHGTLSLVEPRSPWRCGRACGPCGCLRWLWPDSLLRCTWPVSAPELPARRCEMKGLLGGPKLRDTMGKDDNSGAGFQNSQNTHTQEIPFTVLLCLRWPASMATSLHFLFQIIAFIFFSPLE